jgi:GxxExxY protein
MTDLNRITGSIVFSALRIHRDLGPGLLESVYERILARDLGRAGHVVERQKPISFEFEGLWFPNGYKVDLIVDHAVLVEIKSVGVLPPVSGKQLLTYLRLLDYRVGLLLNFGAPLMKDGIQRIANNL